jgi:hypothetical protein
MKGLMKFIQLLSLCLIAPAAALAQEGLRVDLFIAPTRATTSPTTPNTTSGILPPPTTALTPIPGSSAAYAAGLGMEQIFGQNGGPMQHIGGGLDLAAIIPSKGKIGSEIVGSLSLNGYYHFLSSAKTNSNLDPFLTGGYSLLYRDFAANGFNVGGGLNFWAWENWGLMFEVREMIFSNSSVLPANHYTEFRVGFTHRSKR